LLSAFQLNAVIKLILFKDVTTRYFSATVQLSLEQRKWWMFQNKTKCRFKAAYKQHAAFP